MPFMEELRKLFKRPGSSGSSGSPRTPGKPVEVDISSDEAHGATNNSQHDGAASATAAGGDPAALAQVQRRKPRSMAELQQGYEEVMGLVRRIGDHLDSQNRRTERLVELMERLPEALDALPEMHRQNARLLEVLGEHLTQGRKREEVLNDTLGKLSESSGHQTEVLGLLQQQFDTNNRSAEQMTQTLGGFSEALNNIAANNTRSTEVLSTLMRSSEERESRLVEMIGRTQKWMIGTLAGIGVLALAAIVIAAIAMTG